jgi:hypothetical protein
MTPPVATLAPGEAGQKLKYYQKGTFTVGNRLVAEEHRNIEKLLAILERELQVFDGDTAPTTRLVSFGFGLLFQQQDTRS